MRGKYGAQGDTLAATTSRNMTSPLSRTLTNPIRYERRASLGPRTWWGGWLVALVLICAGAGVSAFAQEGDGDEPADESSRARYWERANYPYYDEGFSLTPSRRQKIASPTWQELSFATLFGEDSRRGNAARWSVSEAFVRFGLELESRTANDVETWIKPSLGANLPFRIGEIGVSVGPGFRDDDVVDGLQTGFHARMDGAVWPLWPVGVAGFADYGWYGRGHGDVLQWGIEGRVQVWRALVVGIGYRETIGEGAASALDMSGFTLSVSLHFSAFGGMWDGPKGPDGKR